jgi:C_GCAxxG_C_C family probable redox protein
MEKHQVEQAAQRCTEHWDSGFYCAESVLLSLAEANGVEADWIPSIATGLCAGMARTNRTCGAVSGAIMGLGLSTGRRSPDEQVDENYQVVQEFIRQFEDEVGSTNCRELTGNDMTTPEGLQAYLESDQSERCRGYCEQATRIAMELL